MSTVYVIETVGVGHNGSTVWLEAGAKYDDRDAVVIAHPEKFTTEAPADTEVEERPKRRGRPNG